MDENFFSLENVFGWFVAPIIVSVFVFLVKFIWGVLRSGGGGSSDDSEEENFAPEAAGHDVAALSENEESITIERFLSMLYSHIMSYEITILVIFALPLFLAFFVALLFVFVVWIISALSGDASIYMLFNTIGRLGSGFAKVAIVAAVLYWLFFGPLIRSGVANYFWYLANTEFPKPSQKNIIASYCKELINKKHRFKPFLTCGKSVRAIHQYENGRSYGRVSGMTARQYVEHPSNFR